MAACHMSNIEQVYALAQLLTNSWPPLDNMWEAGGKLGLVFS